MERSKMSILSASPACIGGGAERVAFMLHEQYVSRGLDSWLAVANRNCDDPRTIALDVNEGRSTWARALLSPASRLARQAGRAGWIGSRVLRVSAEPGRYARVLSGHEDFDFPSTAQLLQAAPSTPDVLHLHNLHGAWFDVRALPALSAQAPTIITMHDAWLLTGHCAYPLDCERWKTGCGDCPRLDLYVPIRGDRSASNASVKRDAVAASRLSLACPSRWLLDMVEASGILTPNVQARVVPNGIDTSVFHPADKGAVRAELGLPHDATVLCVAARGLSDSQYKGFETLTRALEILGRDTQAASTTRLLAIGSDAPDTHIGGIPVTFVPFVREPERVARYYQASDLYVHPAKAESFGLVVLEAMACGTPAIAGRVGGVPEIIVDGITGCLVAPNDAAALAASVSDLVGDAERRNRMAAAGIDRVRERYTIERQADTYLDWYAEMIDARRSRS